MIIDTDDYEEVEMPEDLGDSVADLILPDAMGGWLFYRKSSPNLNNTSEEDGKGM